MAFAIRSIWTYPITEQFGNLYVYAGGSDSYYHSRVMQYIIANHTNLVFDPLLKYPVGAINPREPLFDWMNAILGIVFAPFFGGSQVNAGAFFLNLQAPLWAALTVFPIYLIGREIGDRRTGLIAAIIFPFLPATINESIFGYANYLSFYTFIILIVIYAYLRTLKAVGSRRWVSSYRDRKAIVAGFRGFLRTERTAVKWAVFTGVSFGALALAWQGYTYAVAVIGVFIVLVMLIERIRRVDSFGVWFATLIVGVVGFPLAMPYYYFQGEFVGWFDLPLLLFFGSLLLLIPFLFMRDLPWVISIPTLVGVFAAAAAALIVVEPGYFTNIVTGQGYFIKTLIYSTVAEAQSPSFDTLVISYGVITFFLAFAGLGLIVWTLARGRFQRWLLFFLIFAGVSLYLPFSASKFLLLGAPAFALLPAEALRRLWDLGGYGELRQSMRSLTDTRSRLTAFRKSFKARHVLILLLVVGLLLPNIWYGMDAGIPSNVKAGASTQVYNSLPSFLQAPASQASSFYFGAAGSALDTPNLYDSAGYNWLALQDVATPQPQRPAVISWWDYGFQTIDQGQHPSVADNFQNGIDPSGQFLLAQNQSIAIATLSVTLLNAEQLKTGDANLPTALTSALAADGLNLTILQNDLDNEAADYQTVVANPQVYLPVDPSTLTDLNAMFLVTSYYIASAVGPNAVAQVYNDIQAYTGWTIRYALTDSRLIPFSGKDTGIYYAPADLTGRVLDAAGNPEAYFNVTVLGSDGNYYPEGEVPATVTPVQYYINYFAPFYNSMIYRIYFGYNGTDVGLGVGIPGLEGSVANDPVEPGWMMSHFMVVYETAYYCDNATLGANLGSSCFVATNKPDAIQMAATQGGVANLNSTSYFSGGESMLVYYSGETMTGQVTLPNGAPVPGVRVTVSDSWGIPHQTVVTGPNGQYTLVLPPGNDTVNVTMGTFNGISQQGPIVLRSISINVPNAVGFSLRPTTIVYPIVTSANVVQGQVYWNVANQTIYSLGDIAIPGATVTLSGVANGTPIVTTTDVGGTFELTNVPSGSYLYNVTVDGTNYSQSSLLVTPVDSPLNASVGLAPANLTGFVYDQQGQAVPGATITVGAPSGAVTTTTTGPGGNYSLRNFGPGNYTVTAVGPAANARSLGANIQLTDIGENASVNLTEYSTAPATIAVSGAGSPIAGASVRITPSIAYANSIGITNYTSALQNTTIITTASDGVASMDLPIGTYSVYVASYVGSTFEAALSTLVVTAPGVADAPLDLSLRPASWVTGTFQAAGGFNGTSVVVAYDATGNALLLGANNSSFSIPLPAGTYSLLGLQATSTPSSINSGLTSVTLPSSARIVIPTTTSVKPKFVVETPLAGGGEYPAAGAVVTVSIGPNGPSATVYADAQGNVSLAVPGTLAVNQTYCLSAAAPGYVTTSMCGFTPESLSSLGQLAINFTPIALTISLLGTPSGVPVTVWANGTSASAGDYSAQGTSPLSLSVTPGAYTFSAIAPSHPRVAIYRTGANRSATFALGAPPQSLSLALSLEYNTTGSLTLPSGMPAASVTVELSGGGFALTLNGTTYRTGFYAPAGLYSAYVFGSWNDQTYTNLTTTTVLSAGSATPGLHLGLPGILVSGALLDPNGTLVSVSTAATFTSSGGAVATASVSAGTFALVLPAGTTYSVHGAPTTVSVAGPNGSYYVTYTSVSGTTCAVLSSPLDCNLTFVPTTELVWFNGTLSSPGYPGLLTGAITVAGPYPSVSETTIAAPSGQFSAQILPGAYQVYANTAGTSNPMANLTQLTVLPTSGVYAIHLSATWIDSIVVSAPSPGTISGGIASVTVRSPFGATLTIPSVSPGSPLLVALPVGNYVVSALATGTPYGRAANASATASVTVRGGNVGTSLPLAWALTPSVAGVASGPAFVDLPASGGPITLSVGLSNSGNAPVTVRLVASPAFWNFTTTLTDVSLGTNGSAANATGTVRILVPAGTNVVHPPLILSTEVYSTGALLSNVSKVPTIQIGTALGVTIEGVSGQTEVGPTTVRVPFSVTNTGNVPEGLLLTVANAPLLAGLGWNSNILSAAKPLTSSIVVEPGTASALTLNLTASAIAVPPTVGIVSVTILNGSSGIQRSASFSIHSSSVAVGDHLGVSGPGTGAPANVLPIWLLALLALVPAIVLGAIAGVWRWNRTRRWQRW